jgi:hypothetical protein
MSIIRTMYARGMQSIVNAQECEQVFATYNRSGLTMEGKNAFRGMERELSTLAATATATATAADARAEAQAAAYAAAQAKADAEAKGKAQIEAQAAAQAAVQAAAQAAAQAKARAAAHAEAQAKAQAANPRKRVRDVIIIDDDDEEPMVSPVDYMVLNFSRPFTAEEHILNEAFELQKGVIEKMAYENWTWITEKMSNIRDDE